MNNIQDINKLLENWGQSLADYSPRILLAIIAFIAFYLLAKLIKKIALKSYSKVFGEQSDVATLISVIIYFFFLLFGSFLALEILGLESVLTKLLAGAGIAGIAAGFAFKDIAGNAFGGVLLNVQRPFKVGDLVEIDDHFGTVEEIGWITTSVKTRTGQQVFVPNQIIYNNPFINYSSYKKRRITLKTGVSYGDDLEQVKKVALDEVRKVGALLQDEPVDFYFTDIGSSTFNFELRFWINFTRQREYHNAVNEVIMRIKKRFEQENISLAYSVTTLDFGVKGGVSLFDKSINIDSNEKSG